MDENTKWNHIHYSVCADKVIIQLHEVIKKIIESAQIVGIKYEEGVTIQIYDQNSTDLISKAKEAIYQRIDQITYYYIKPND